MAVAVATHDSAETVVIPEAPFLMSIAGISASLAGLAGLVAGLRRGTDFRAMDVYRLREIVEFSFGNVLLALSTIPVALSVGSTNDAVRIVALAALVYSILHVAVLYRRGRRMALQSSRAWTAIAAASDVGIVVSVIATVSTGTIGAFEALLLVLLARPMAAFLLVLASFESSSSAP